MTMADATARPLADEVRTWQLHRDALMPVPASEAAYRGCIGLGLVVDETRQDAWQTYGFHYLLPNESVRWATLVDLPFGRWRFEHGRPRGVQWATVRPATVRYGAPTLAAGTEGDQAWDFRRMPGNVGGVPRDRPQLFRAFNAINWAMTVYAATHRRTWKPHVAEVTGPLGGSPTAAAEAYGRVFRDAAGPAVSPAAWMPRPYLAFPASKRGKLYNALQLGDGRGALPPAFRAAFMNAIDDGLAYTAPFAGTLVDVKKANYGLAVPALRLTLAAESDDRTATVWVSDKAWLRHKPGEPFKVGDTLVREPIVLAEEWHRLSWETKWARLPLTPAERDRYGRLWLDREFLELTPGVIHAPAVLTSVAALRHALPGGLVWDVGLAHAYYRDDCDTFVFPPLPAARPETDLVGTLPGPLAYNLTPTDDRYINLAGRAQRK